MGSQGNTSVREGTNISKDDDDDEAYIHALQLWRSFIVTPVLVAATELDLFEIISKETSASSSGKGEGISPSDIASRLQTKNLNAACVLDQMLHLLTSHSLLTCSSFRTLEYGKVERLYGLAPAGKLFVRDVDGVSLASNALFGCSRDIMDMCYFVKDAIIEGGCPFEKAQKKSLFECMETNVKMGQAFDKIMSDSTTMIMKRVVRTYKGFEGLTSLVDVGGGNGTSLNIIISANPSIKGINFDLPHVIDRAPSFDNIGIKHIGGDMFTGIPKGNAILLKWICHDWNDKKCLILLKNCYQALPDDGKVILIESILPIIPETSSLGKSVSQQDTLMFAQFGSKERTHQEFEVLAKGAGFSIIRIVYCVYGQWVMELYK